MEFSPFNSIVQLCLLGMELEEKGQPQEALQQFLKAWKEARDDFEKFLAAFYIARQQKSVADNLKWLETSLNYALKSNKDLVQSALPSLYFNIARCYEELNEHDKAKVNYESANRYKHLPADKGPFYHGTKADLKTGDFLTANFNSNYRSDLAMNHIYFTALLHGAGLAAALARGEGPERVYIVQPTGTFENDPNLTDKKFPGNPTRSYRSMEPLQIVGEVSGWSKPEKGELQKFRKKLEDNKGDIIN